MKTLTTLLAGLLLACGGSQSEGPTEPAGNTDPAPAEVAPAKTAMLGTGDVTIYIEGNPAIRMSADGNVEANMGGGWQQVAQVKDDQIVAKGKTMLSVDAEGKVTFEGGPEGIVLSGTSVTFGDKNITVEADGSVSGLPPQAAGKVRVEGATDDATKRTAVIMLLGVFMSGKSEPVDTPVEEATPEATPPS